MWALAGGAAVVATLVIVLAVGAGFGSAEVSRLPIAFGCNDDASARNTSSNTVG